jgi:hypothetical protein
MSGAGEVAVKRKPKSLRQLAQSRCDRYRRRAPHLKFFIGDPPCSICKRVVKEKHDANRGR